MARKKRLIIPFFVSHNGCPERCVFCNQQNINGRKELLPDIDDIGKMISRHLESWRGAGRKEVAFYGGSFTGIERHDQERLLKAVAPFISSGMIDAIRISTRPELISADIISFLSGYGVETIELGVQSMDDEVLRLSGRSHRAADTVGAAELIKGRGLILGCQLMMGLPGDNRDKAIASANRVARLVPDFVRIYPTLVIEGTKLHRMYKRGEYLPPSLRDAIGLCAEMAEIFRGRSIEVARIGLQPEKELERTLVAGPYHPAFGEMVETHLFYRKAERLLSGRDRFELSLSFVISPKDESAFRGPGNSNIKKFKESFNAVSINVVKDEGLERGGLKVYQQ